MRTVWGWKNIRNIYINRIRKFGENKAGTKIKKKFLLFLLKEKIFRETEKD